MLLQKKFNSLKVKLHRKILRANSRVYEGKAVIGGTITGCVSRLEAIRTINPFAILVEEASEVMEPLLVSCFGTSTQTGDDRRSYAAAPVSIGSDRL